MKTFYIVDANAYIHRAYHALPPLSTSDNRQVNAVYGFIKLLLKIKETFKPDYIAACFDYPAKNFRHALYSDYKAHRKPLDEALISQMPAAREAVEALNIAKCEIEGYEADDLIASIAERNKKENIKTVIVTGDKDILQLVVNDKILVWNDSKDIMFDEEKVEEKFGVPPKRLLDVFSLMGDAADNIPGIKGIGEKTAVKLINEFTTLENVLANADAVKGKTGELLKNYKEDALKSRMLAQLKTDAPVNDNASDFESKNLDEKKASDFFAKYEFNSLLKKYFGKEIQPAALERGKNVSFNFDFKPEEFKSEIANSKVSVEKLVKEIQKNGEFALKTLGSSADSLKSKIVGVSFYAGEAAYYVPVGHNDFTLTQISFDEFKEVFSEVLSDKKIKKIGFDLKHERNIYKTNGLEINGLEFDAMLASYCLNPLKPHDISYMSKEYLNFDAGDESFLGKGAKKIAFADAPAQQSAQYANSVSYASYNLRPALKKVSDDAQLSALFSDIEMPLVEILSDMELAGIKIDAEFLKTFNEKIVSEIKNVENKVYAAAGGEFNVNSPKQLGFIMFEKLNMPVIKKTKTGYSTDEEVLTELSSYEFAREILKYRELQKLKSTYIDPIVNYCAYYGKRIHTIFNQAVTSTGRLSSTEPNLQNIPIKSAYGREFRKAFIPEDKKIFVSADYSQIDLRVLAHISRDEKLIRAFKDGQDIHCATAREVFDIPKAQQVPADLRSAAKSINFGIVYGMSPFGLSKQLGIPFTKAKEYIEGYFERYSGVKKWMKQMVIDAQKDGYVRTITGRIRYMPEFAAHNAQVKQAGERIALNMPIQGTSADIIKIAMVNIYNELKNRKIDALMLLQVHDDLLFEVAQSHADELKELIKDKMENAVSLLVPLSVDIKTGKSWGEMS
ncbi:MAG: DNA polymerase I [Endomicrobium sp.]|jgi:DNA polymerase-1|nr:DNA polymerase I [Endomicrobium sp.]